MNRLIKWFVDKCIYPYRVEAVYYPNGKWVVQYKMRPLANWKTLKKENDVMFYESYKDAAAAAYFLSGTLNDILKRGQ